MKLKVRVDEKTNVDFETEKDVIQATELLELAERVRKLVRVSYDQKEVTEQITGKTPRGKYNKQNKIDWELVKRELKKGKKCGQIAKENNWNYCSVWNVKKSMGL